ncbi:MAG: hypothetical protein KDD82_09630 [Planctomycetes bacterium]|nr:hypothetical protein [Planctomycetota bacterium]
MDRRHRDLERTWRSSGSVDDEARWLTARVRGGELSLVRLELAACCDHPGAERALVGLGAPALHTSWVTDVRRWGEAVCLRSSLWAARRALPVWQSAFATDPRPARALRLVEDWLGERKDPAEEQGGVLVDAERAAELCQRELAEVAELAGSKAARRAEDASVAVYFAVRGLEAVARHSERQLEVPAEWLRRRAARRGLSSKPPSLIDDFLRAERRAARACNEARSVTRSWINARVAAWALG